MKKHLERRFPIANLQWHKWIKFRDANGDGHAEPEGFIELTDRVILFECKLTGWAWCRGQMELLYVPLLEHIFKKPVYSLLICKNVAKETPRPRFETPEDFIRSDERFGVWHWTGD